MELAALKKVVPDITALGSALVAISPQLEQFTLEFVNAHKLPFNVLVDRGNQVAGQFGIVHQLPPSLRKVYLDLGIDLPAHNGDDSWTLPMPARYIIDRQGIIRSAEISPDYTVRPEPQATVAQLKEIVAAK